MKKTYTIPQCPTCIPANAPASSPPGDDGRDIFPSRSPRRRMEILIGLGIGFLFSFACWIVVLNLLVSAITGGPDVR